MAKKGQTFNRYDEATKKEAVRLRLEEQWSYPMIMEKFGIKSDTQIMSWVCKAQNGESFEDYRGKWAKKHFNFAEEEIAHLKAQVEYLKKLKNDNALYNRSSLQNCGGFSCRILQMAKDLRSSSSTIR